MKAPTPKETEMAAEASVGALVGFSAGDLVGCVTEGDFVGFLVGEPGGPLGLLLGVLVGALLGLLVGEFVGASVQPTTLKVCLTTYITSLFPPHNPTRFTTPFVRIVPVSIDNSASDSLSLVPRHVLGTLLVCTLVFGDAAVSDTVAPSNTATFKPYPPPLSVDSVTATLPPHVMSVPSGVENLQASPGDVVYEPTPIRLKLAPPFHVPAELH